ncbi:TPA: response regulator [Candidatus Poribacteria bacterium]|nr:response regulator [Candidatus Poribacteria bacterium]
MKSKILIVDDDPMVRNLLSEQLQIHGYTTAVAASGKEALEILLKEEFDLIISDVRMYPMDGVELLQQVSILYPEMAKILLTGYNDEHASEYAFESEGVFKIPKPYGEELMIVIKRALETRMLKRRIKYFGQKLIPEYARELLETYGVSREELAVEVAEGNTTVFSLAQKGEV